jgi:S-adenosyl methyltransferase
VDDASGSAPNEAEPRQANVARVYDYLLGGKDNYIADRAAGEHMKKVTPHAVTFVKENRRFMQRAAHYVAHRGVTRFIDIGTGLPTAGPLHEVVQEVHPNARTIYIDNDDIVLTHARALMAGDGQTEVVGGDITTPENVLANEHVAGMLADGEPVAVLMLAVLHFLPDEQVAHAVRTFKEALPSGSYLLISHVTADLHDAETTRTAAQSYTERIQSIHLRSTAEITRFADGMVIVEPGVVPTPQWPIRGGAVGSGWGLAVVARKP